MSGTIIHALTADELRDAGAPVVFTTTTGAWKAILRDWWETHPDGPQRPLYPAQPEMLLIDMLSYGFAQMGQEAQAIKEQGWLLFASGVHAALMSANNSTFRLPASAARTELQFRLPEARSVVTHVASGLEVAAPGSLVFRTLETVTIAPGALTATVTAQCTATGPVGNGLAPGTINAPLSALNFGLTVTNTTESLGGADTESDAALTARAMRAHDRISKAGPNGSYVAQAFGYSPAIVDVGITRPEPGDVALHILLDTGAPDEAFCDALAASLDHETRRPMGDDLFVWPAEAITLDIAGTAKVAGDAARAKPLLDATLADTALIWNRLLGAYVSEIPLVIAARSIGNLVDIEIEMTLSGGATRQLADNQFIVIGAVDIVTEAV